MNGPTGYNVRFRRSPNYAQVTVRITPSVFNDADFTAKALVAAGAKSVEIWKSGTLMYLTNEKGDLV